MPKIYNPNEWTDEVLAEEAEYSIDGGDPVTIELTTDVAVAGTGVNADRMNNIENGVDGLDTKLADSLDLLTTGGTSTAYTITTIGAADLETGESFRVKFHATAGTTPTLNRDAKGAKDLKYYDASGTKQAVTSAQIVANMILTIIYDGVDYVIIGGGGGGADVTPYQIAVSVASGSLTLALKDKDGNDPSAASPVKVQIGGVVREVTSALSVTAPAGQPSFDADSAKLATFEIDYFTYLGYNATDGVVIAFSRIPFAGTYSDFSATPTSDRYAAISTRANATASDPYVVIGRFAATLSAGAGYNWSVPTFTGDNLKHHPIYHTRRLSYAPQWASTGTAPALVNGTLVGEYIINGRNCVARIWQVNGSSTTYGTGIYTWTLPIAAGTVSNFSFVGLARIFDASPTGYYVGVSAVNSGGTSGSFATHGATGSVGATVPITFAQNDVIGGTFDYNL